MTRRDNYDDLEDFGDPEHGRPREVMDIIPERYDDDADSRYARKSAHTRLILTIALVLLAIAALGVAARQIFAPADDVSMPLTAEIPTLTPGIDEGRNRPENPGGMQPPRQEQMVYDQMAGGRDSAPVRENLLPPAETPVPPRISYERPSQQAALPPAPIPGAQTSGAAEPAPVVSSLPAPVTPPPASVVQPEPAKPAPNVAQTQPAPPVQPVVTAPTATAPKPAATGGAWVLQLASVRSEAAAKSEWARISRANNDLLTGLSSEIVKADLGTKGVYWRLRAGSLDEARARSICQQLKSRKQDCIVARR